MLTRKQPVVLNGQKSIKDFVIQTDDQIKTVPIDSVKQWKDNPRFNDHILDKMIAILQARGQVTPIVVWKKNNTIYKGNNLPQMDDIAEAIDQ